MVWWAKQWFNHQRRVLSTCAAGAGGLAVAIASQQQHHPSSEPRRIPSDSTNQLAQKSPWWLSRTLWTPWLSPDVASSRRGIHLAAVVVARCDSDEDGLLYAEKDFPDGYTEAERFLEVLEYHRTLLPDYLRRWSTVIAATESSSKKDRVSWPNNVPSDGEVGPLEVDYSFCRRSPNYRGVSDTCDDLKFRIASYYLAKEDGRERKKGFLMIKDLAERGHADGMCYYGILLNQGTIEGVDVNPKQAVVWWRRCVDFHRHIWASFELGVALYTGEGVAENATLASKFFRRAAHLGHAGAAFMLADMLLNGVGIERDRASALEWFVTAAELGHPLAQERVLFVIQQDFETLEKGDLSSEIPEESLKWVGNPDTSQEAREVMVERRYTIGGGPGNPEVRKRRKSIVKESREDD